MIERIVIGNFKSFRKADLKLGRLNLFIRTNASGKSNFFDALRVLQGIGNGFTIHEILDGKPKSATSEVWDGIRGGSTKACFEGTTGAVPNTEGEISIQVFGKSATKQRQAWEYSIGFSPLDGRVARERLMVGSEIYDSAPVHNLATDPVLEVRYYGGKRGRPTHLKFEKSRPVLTQFARGNNGKWTKGDGEEAAAIAVSLANRQRIDPSPALLRVYSQAHTIKRMGEHGENFAALIRIMLIRLIDNFGLRSAAVSQTSRSTLSHTAADAPRTAALRPMPGLSINRIGTVYSLTDIPRFNELIQRQPISDLFAEGWLETAS